MAPSAPTSTAEASAEAGERPAAGAIRNVVLVGHAATGKSTLAEAILRVAGQHPEDHGSRPRLMDFRPEEVERGHSLGLAAATLTVDGCRINIFDTPGRVEALGDTYPALGAADCAVFVVDASVGLEPQHEQLWRAAAARDLPRMVFLNKLDMDHASYQRTIDALRGAYGQALAPVHMPIGVGDEFTGVIDLLGFRAVVIEDGQRREVEVPEQRREQASSNRTLLVEALLENDDDLLLAYLEGEDPSNEDLAELFATGIAREGFFPVLCGSARRDVGVELLLEFLIEEAPSPLDGPTPADPDAPTAGVVVKTLSDQYVGRINLLKLYGGRLSVDDRLTDARTGAELRLHHLFRLQGEQREPVEGVGAGDVVAVAKLEDVVTGDVLYDEDGYAQTGPPVLELPEPPPGYHRAVLVPVTASDDDKLSTALHRLLEEDPSIRREVDRDHNSSVLAFYGPQHVDVTVSRLARGFGVETAAKPAPVAFRETVRAPVEAVGKHVKQSGGHGQYGIAHIELSPLPRGTGFQFDDAIVGGAIPHQFIPSVEKGIREAMQQGPLGGFPVVDIRVRLVDGKHHSVDSSDAAFQMAGIRAFREAMAATIPVLLEPVMQVDISIPDELTGNVMSDLAGRRGQILGTDMAGSGRTMVHAEVPEVELQTFAAELRALTSGRGTVAMRYHHHQEVSEGTARQLLERHGRDGHGE